MTAPRWPRLVSLGLLSAAGLFLEITLTRLFSTLFYPPYVFVVISLALLGIGLGAGTATWRKSVRGRQRLPLYIALAAFACLLLALMSIQSAFYGLQIVLGLLVVAPYYFVGLALATFFSLAPGESPRLYMADLLGASVGAMLSIPALNWLGGIDGLLLAASVFGIAGIVVGEQTRRTLPAAVAVVAMVLLVGNRQTDWLQLDMANLGADKPISESLEPDGEVLATEWDSFSRTDLVRPSEGGPYRLYMDGAAGSVMPPAEDDNFLFADIGMFPFATAQPDRVFVVGPGGGLDVWFGLQAGAEEIVAVEVNPGSVRLVERFTEYNGDLYGNRSVRVLIDEGRSVLRRGAGSYDLIFLSQVVTLAAERSGYALTENTIYTVEAFQDYLQHLQPEGQIALKLYDEPTLTRALSTAMAALRAEGESDAEALRHTAAFLAVDHNPPIPLLLVRKAPFSAEESLELGLVAQRVGFVPLYLPGVHAEPPLDAVEAGALSFSDIVARSEADISPTTDDRPFFYQFERGIPRQLRLLLYGLSALVLLGAGLVLRVTAGASDPSLRWAPLYFAGLGVGFMAIELGVIQQTRLFIGHPTLAVTTVLAVLLIGGGLGSGLAGRWLRAGGRSIPVWPAIAVVCLVALWAFSWPLVSDRLLAAKAPLRLLASAIVLLPLSLSMGIPFPQGLRVVGRGGEQHVALGWAVNGVMTVLGSAGAITVAIVAGFRTVLLMGALAYAIAAGAAYLSGRAK